MNTSILQRLSFLFTLLCLTAALAVHPDAAAAAAPTHAATAAAPAPAQAPSASAAPAKDDHAAAGASAATSDDEFNDDSDQAGPRRLAQPDRVSSRLDIGNITKTTTSSASVIPAI